MQVAFLTNFFLQKNTECENSASTVSCSSRKAAERRPSLARSPTCAPAHSQARACAFALARAGTPRAQARASTCRRARGARGRARARSSRVALFRAACAEAVLFFCFLFFLCVFSSFGRAHPHPRPRRRLHARTITHILVRMRASAARVRASSCASVHT